MIVYVSVANPAGSRARCSAGSDRRPAAARDANLATSVLRVLPDRGRAQIHDICRELQAAALYAAERDEAFWSAGPGSAQGRAPA